MKVILTLDADPYALAHLVHARIASDRDVAQACMMQGAEFLADVFHAVAHLSKEGQQEEDLKKVFAAATSIEFRRDDVPSIGAAMPRGHGGDDVNAPTAPPSPPSISPAPSRPPGHGASCVCAACEAVYVETPTPTPDRRRKSSRRAPAPGDLAQHST